MTKHSQGRVRLLDADDRAVVYELINRPMTDPTEAAKLVPFCLNCHDGDGDTPFSAGRTPPYVRENLWNVAAHKTGGDYGTPLTCMGDGESFGCHATGHGSENIKLLNADSADSLVEFCYNCHTSTSIWNTMCNNCHYYYGGHHAGMSCGSASCHEANSVHRIIHVTHSYTKYLWTPAGVPEIVEVEGAAGSHILEVTFSEAVYSHADLTGQLTPADLQFIDDDNHRTIVSVDHTAGASTARVSLSSPLDISK